MNWEWQGVVVAVEEGDEKARTQIEITALWNLTQSPQNYLLKNVWNSDNR